jgi:hypothetical protein
MGMEGSPSYPKAKNEWIMQYYVLGSGYAGCPSAH